MARQTGYTRGTAAMAGSAPITVATDDTQFGAVGSAADVDGNVHGQLRYIGEAVDGLEGSIPTPVAEYKSPTDFTATYTSNVTITLSALPFTIEDDSQIVYIKYIPEDGSASGVLVNGQNGVTITESSSVLTVDGGGTPFASGDVYEIGINANKKAYDQSLDLNKTQEQKPVPTWRTDPVAYTTLAPDDVTYDEGGVIDVRDYNTLNFMYSKTASDADNSYIKVVYLDASDSAVDYQETSLATPGSGVTVISANVYERDKAALVEILTLSTKGMPFMRIDIAKVADTGTDSTFTTKISKAYL